MRCALLLLGALAAAAWSCGPRGAEGGPVRSVRPVPQRWGSPSCAEERRGGGGLGYVGAAVGAGGCEGGGGRRRPRCASEVLRSVMHRSMDIDYLRHPNAVDYSPHRRVGHAGAARELWR